MKEYKITQQQLEMLIRYLALRPFAEVQILMTMLQQIHQAEEKKDAP